MSVKTSRRMTLAVLDIFGFEEFKENSFEQLCINFANETLHFFFTKHVFKIEQQEYAKDKIDWQHIPCPDNQIVLNLICKKPEGILPLLDDESNFPKATDSSFLEKCHYNHALNESYCRPRMSSMEFGIRHYAGQVWYTVDGFLDKNRDTLRMDVLDLLTDSRISMISKMFYDLRSTAESYKTFNRSDGRFVTMKPRAPTVATRFQDSLNTLLDTVSRCHPWFVRCIKPNNEKAPMKFDIPVVLTQLRYSGVLETVKIRQSGYSVRLKFQSFVSRYRCLLQGRRVTSTSNKDLCRSILESVIRDDNKQFFQLGQTKVFMRESVEQCLETERAKIIRGAVVTLQKYARGFLIRKRLRNEYEAATLIQSTWRGFRCRRNYLKILKGIARAQATWKMQSQRKQFGRVCCWRDTRDIQFILLFFFPSFHEEFLSRFLMHLFFFLFPMTWLLLFFTSLLFIDCNWIDSSLASIALICSSSWLALPFSHLFFFFSFSLSSFSLLFLLLNDFQRVHKHSLNHFLFTLVSLRSSLSILIHLSPHLFPVFELHVSSSFFTRHLNPHEISSLITSSSSWLWWSIWFNFWFCFMLTTFYICVSYHWVLMMIPVCLSLSFSWFVWKLKQKQLQVERREAQRLASERAKLDQEREEASRRNLDRLQVPSQLAVILDKLNGEKVYLVCLTLFFLFFIFF